MQKRTKPLMIAALAIVLLVIVSLIGANIYYYYNPLDEHSVSFQEYLPSSLPTGVKIASTDASAMILKRDPRHERKEWVGWDLEQAKLHVMLKDNTGKYIATITESVKPSMNSCTVQTSGYHRTPKGQVYCLTPYNQVYGNEAGMDTVIGDTSIGASVTVPTASPVLSNQDWDTFVDSFQKVHLLNIRVEATSDPMAY